MEANGNTHIKVGMTVVYRGGWGHDAPKEAKITSMELCECEGDKYGDPVKEAPVTEIERCVFDLNDGHWCYGYQIDSIVTKPNK